MASTGIDFTAIPRTAIRVITTPSSFFRDMPKTGGFVEPLVFLVVMSVVSGVIGGLLHAINSVLGLHLYAGAVMGAASLVFLPAYYAIGSAVFGFVVAAILFVLWKLMGSRESYETAYRCSAYLAAISPIITMLAIIPYVGGAVGILIGTYYLVTAGNVVHAIPLQKAWLVFGIIAAVSMVLNVSSQIAARRVSHNIERGMESWKGAAQEMEKAAEEMRKQMEKQMKEQKQ